MTSNEFDAILNILEGLHSAINIIASPNHNLTLTVAYLSPKVFSSMLTGFPAEAPPPQEIVQGHTGSSQGQGMRIHG